MPLSEDEQRVLKDIERNFYENDPKFAKVVETSEPYPSARRNAKLSVVGMVVCLIVLLISFTTQIVIGLIAFLGMVGCAFLAFQNFRRAGVDLDHGDGVDELRDRVRRRFDKN